MSGLDDIHVSVTDIDESDGRLRENVHAILHEIETLLDALLQTGETSAIDIRSLPLLPGDYDALASALGTGEISAEFDGGSGPTVVVETGTSGVWWVTHYNDENEIAAEFIEVTRIPEILMSQDDDIQDSLKGLRERLQNERSH
ncbi:MAG: hydrogenase expression/formation protein [Acidiferrobacterales bacterium]|jgi:hydrogenase-1 operon protein HyaF|nr:hydrogenase expression/formation protein [Acidiferrobacterales bacterium]